MRKVAIVGRGIIGSSWALVFARAGLSVSIWDHSGQGFDATVQPIFRQYKASRSALPANGEKLENHLSVEHDIEAVLHDADYIQESVPEDLALKARVLRHISELSSPEAIVASSTSGFHPSVLAQDLTRNERFLVVHPLTPPHLLPITEVVPSKFTSIEAVAATERLLTAVGQTPIRIRKEISGFVLNRILAAMMNEFFHLIAEGVLRPEDADLALTEGFGIRWACIGPFAAMDLNAKGGIEEYLSRYGYIFDAVARERGCEPPLSRKLIGELGAAMRAMYAQRSADDRIAERDRAIARILEQRAVQGRRDDHPAGSGRG